MDSQTLALQRVYRWNKKVFITCTSLLLVLILFAILSISQQNIFAGFIEIAVIGGTIAFVGAISSGYKLVKSKKIIRQNVFTETIVTQETENSNRPAGYAIVFLGIVFTVISAIFIESRSLTIMFAFLSAPLAIVLFVLGFRVLKKQ